MLAYGWNLIDGFTVVYLGIWHGGPLQKLSAIKIMSGNFTASKKNRIIRKWGSCSYVKIFFFMIQETQFDMGYSFQYIFKDQ